jgi:ribose/xylose/arabinose/galactoside ABC-type transport system permease subunit
VLDTIKKKANIISILKGIAGKQEMGIIIPTVLLIIIVQSVNSVFLSYQNIMNVLRSAGYMLITSLGMTLVLIAGGIDLSVGSILAFGGCITGIALKAGLPISISILLGLLAGALCGFVNGIIIVKFRIPPLMMTLGMYYMARGLVYIITLGVPVFPLPPEFQRIEQQDILGFPSIVVVAAVLSVIFYFIMNRTVFGRKAYAIGGNIETARVSGINIGRNLVALYSILGMLAGMTGIFMAARLGSAQSSAGVGYELQVIAAVIIGGTSTYGGRGTLLGTVIGVIFMNILASSMTILKISPYWQNFVIGAVLVIAVLVDQIRRNRMERG